MTRPLRSTGITPASTLLRGSPPLSGASVLSASRLEHARAFSLGIAGQVLTFRTRARLSFAPPTCRMPLGQSQCIPQALPGRWVSPRFWHRLIAFRHFCSGSLALASLNLACRNPVPAFPQRSPPLLLTTAACGGLRSTPDCRLRRALLHLSYSCASPFGPAILVTHDPQRTSARRVQAHRTGLSSSSTSIQQFRAAARICRPLREIELAAKCLIQKQRAAAREEPPPAMMPRLAYFRLAIAVRSNLPVATKVAPHQLEPKPPGLIEVKLPVNVAVWSLVKALQSPLFRSVS